MSPKLVTNTSHTMTNSSPLLSFSIAPLSVTHIQEVVVGR